MIGLDVETTGLTPHDGRRSLVQVAVGGDTHVVDAFAVDPTPLFAALEEEHVVAHNANFEELWAREHRADLFLEDTLIMSRVLYGGTDGFKRLRHSLADMVERELGETLPKEEQTSDWSRRPLAHE